MDRDDPYGTPCTAACDGQVVPEMLNGEAVKT